MPLTEDYKGSKLHIEYAIEGEEVIMNKASTWAWICALFTILAITSGVIAGIYDMGVEGSIRHDKYRDLLIALFALVTFSSVCAILSFLVAVNLDAKEN